MWDTRKLTPSRGFRQEQNADGAEEGWNCLDCQWKSPLCSTGIDKVKAESSPAVPKFVSNQNPFDNASTTYLAEAYPTVTQIP